MAVRLAVVDHDAGYRSALRDLLAVEPGFEPAEVFDSAVSLLSVVARAARRPWGPPWDLALVRLEHAPNCGIETTKRLRASFPAIQVILLAAVEDSRAILRAILAGVDGYLLRQSGADDVVAEIRAILDGGSSLTPAVARSILEFGAAAGWNPSERALAVLTGTARGRPLAEVAERLATEVRVVRSEVRGIYRSLRAQGTP